MEQEFTKEQQFAIGKAIGNLVCFGFFLGVAAVKAAQSLNTKRSKMRRENIRLVGKLNREGLYEKANAALKAIDTAEEFKYAEDQLLFKKEELAKAQTSLKEAGINYDIPTFVRNGGKVDL